MSAIITSYVVKDNNGATATLVIKGSGFGGAQYPITYNNTAVTITAWSDTEITGTIASSAIDPSIECKILASATDAAPGYLDSKSANSLTVKDDKIQLVNDLATPGANKFYGTDESGLKGYRDVPSAPVSSVNSKTGAVTLSAGDVGAAIAGHTHTSGEISGLGTASSKNTGVAAGNIPVLDANGKIDVSLIPAAAISESFVVANEAEMLALTCEVNDMAIRTDGTGSFILRTAGPSVLSHWQLIQTPTSPVTSVAGKVGNVTLSSSDVGLGNVTNQAQMTTSHPANAIAGFGTTGASSLVSRNDHTHSNDSAIGGPYAASTHNHAGTYANASHSHTQSESHGSSDTDASTSALHHTIGTGSYQAAAGNHNHAGVYANSSHAHTNDSNIGGPYAASTHSHTGYAAESHSHTQVQSHSSADTDLATTSLHHTIGTGANQAAAGNHNHAGVYASNSHTHASGEITGLGTAAVKNITISTSDPSGGSNGDVWIKYTA